MTRSSAETNPQIPTRLALFLLEIKMAHKQLGDMIDQLEDEVKKEASK